MNQFQIILLVLFSGGFTIIFNVTESVCEEEQMDWNVTNVINSTKSRGKRYLDYLQKSRMFFRANVKGNIIKVNQLWAHAYGFRANYPIENDKEHRPFKRDVYETIEHLMNHHGFDGRACVLKSFCEATKTVSSESGILFKMFKLIFTLEGNDRKYFPYLKSENCQQIFHHHCPLSFNNISPYTDDI